jgi:pimeloyl-ACP methyl ester carboxylesterase
VSNGNGRIIEVNGVSLFVEDHGAGRPVLLIHGWPDSCYLWRNQIPFLTGHGFRPIAPDMRGSVHRQLRRVVFEPRVGRQHYEG